MKNNIENAAKTYSTPKKDLSVIFALFKNQAANKLVINITRLAIFVLLLK